MESRKVYEYIIVKDWLDELEKGTRLYYDYIKQAYVYHYEYERSIKSDRYESKSINTSDYTVSMDIADKGILNDRLIAGPELGELQINKE